MPKESNLELKVGVFVILALIGLTILIFSNKDATVFDRGDSLKIIFNFANGLKKSAPVRIAGVEVGIVKNIKLYFDQKEHKTKVEVEVKIKNDIQIPADTSIMINQLGLLGEKYVEITPGVDNVNLMRMENPVDGNDPIAQELIAERVMNVASKLDVAIDGVNHIIRDEDNVASLKMSLQNISLLTGNLKDITTEVKEGRGTVGKLFYDPNLYDNIQDLTADLKANPWKLLYRPKTAK